MEQTVAQINISDIEFGERYRQDYTGIEELGLEMKEKGIISAFTVKYNIEGAEKPYLLVAGGRRFKAATHAEIKIVPAVIYPVDMTDLQIRELELMENTLREDFTWAEELKLTEDIHNLQVEIHGSKSVGGPNVKGHSERDTAKLLGRSKSSINEDLALAKFIEKVPEIKKLRNKAEAVKFVKEFRKAAKAQNVKENVENSITTEGVSKVHERLINSYKVEPADKNYLKGGFFRIADTLADSIADMVILDIPYVLQDDIQKEIAERSAVDNDADTWMTKESYLPMLNKFLEHAYRLLKPDSWLLVWFGAEPWFEPTYQAILDAGFEGSRVAGTWVKTKGYAHYPKYYLGNAYEHFFYMRKGMPMIKNQGGHTNLFHHSVPHDTVRIHQTEKPVELEQEIMSVFLDEGANIIVPCAGSGNSILAAANLNMLCTAWDVNEQLRTGFIANVIANTPPNYKTKKGE